MPICPICGTKVSEGAGFCPRCLRQLMKGQAPRGNSKKKLTGIIVACVVIVSLVIVLTTYLPKVPSGSVAELEYVALSAHDFAERLFAPESTNLQRDGFWKDYGGKRVQWTSELKYVSSIQQGPVAYFVNPLGWTRTEVVAVFDESQRSSLLELREGDLVTYTGVLDNFGVAEINLTDCTIISLSIVPLWWNADIETYNKRIMFGDDVLCLGPSTYEDATEYQPRTAPKITTINRETGALLWENEQTETILVGIDSHYIYVWHPLKIISMRDEDPYWHWYRSNIMALDKVNGQISWDSSLSEDTHCQSQIDCLPDEWSISDFMSCCILQGSVKDNISDKGEGGLNFLVDKLPLTELTYEYQGITYRSACAVYGGVGIECGVLQALDQQTGEVLWMMTFKERGVNDFSVVDGILYVSTDKGVGAFQL